MSDLPQELAALGLTSLPFPKAPPPDAIFRSAAADELLARLDFAHRLRGFALLTGDVGAGKSTLLRLFLHRLDHDRSPAVYIADSALSPREFYAHVLQHFGVLPAKTQSQTRRQFATLLTDLAQAQGKSPLIVIDEGHELAAEMVRELRYLQNVHLDAESPFTLILTGQPELRAMLRLKAFEAVHQRILVRFHLGPLSQDETKAFVTHALAQAGITRPLFTDSALALLHQHAHGLPRRIGTIAIHALLDAALTKASLVEEPSVRRALAELED